MSAAPVDAVESYLFSGVVKGLAVSVYDFHTPQCNNNNNNLHSLHLGHRRHSIAHRLLCYTYVYQFCPATLSVAPRLPETRVDTNQYLSHFIGSGARLQPADCQIRCTTAAGLGARDHVPPAPPSTLS